MRHDSNFLKFMNIMDTIMSLLSGYLYMWFARFGMDMNEEDVHFAGYFIEVYFIFSMYKNFVTDFTIQGQTEPIRDL